MITNKSRELIIKKRGYRKDIKGDKFSLYIANYPVTVEYLRKRIGSPGKILVELCCGVGVTLEYIGSVFKKIIGIDKDKIILGQCRNILESVGLLDKTLLILGDINDDQLLKKIKADVVIYDIPFWSPHKSEKQGDLTEKNPPLKIIVDKIRKYITKDIIIFCPPTYRYYMVKDELGSCEFQKVYINGKHDRNHIYLGGLMEKEGKTETRLFQ